jgi:sugar lactone lactonase YvrE
MRTLSKPDVLIPARATVGEGPVIDRRTGRLCWVDIPEGVLHEDDPTGAALRAAATLPTTQLGAVAPRANSGGFAVAVADGFGYWADGRLELVEEVLPEPYRRMNDAKCDSAGRLWAGSTHLEYAAGAGALHRWDGGGGGGSSATVERTGFTLPNGLGWSPDDATMYLADSYAHVLLRADFDAADGRVGEFTPLCRIEPGLPDGLAVDADGCVWIAVWGGWQVRRYDPEGRRLLATVPMPVSQPSSCAFGDDGTLYISSASAGLDASALAAQPHAGSVFALHTDCVGVPVAPFAN